MELIKKTTILFPPDLYAQMARLAKQRKSSVGELVRSACRLQYGLAAKDSRISAVAELASLSLPVGSSEQMEAESVPAIEGLQ
jgi:hypothetical protein